MGSSAPSRSNNTVVSFMYSFPSAGRLTPPAEYSDSTGIFYPGSRESQGRVITPGGARDSAASDNVQPGQLPGRLLRAENLCARSHLAAITCDASSARGLDRSYRENIKFRSNKGAKLRDLWLNRHESRSKAAIKQAQRSKRIPGSCLIHRTLFVKNKGCILPIYVVE